MWGMDLLGTFTMAPRHYKHLVVIVDYFTKWIEAKPLTAITLLKVQSFTFKNIIYRFDNPPEIITDDRTQFTGSDFREMIEAFKLKKIS
jgi:hypothetical protein